MDKEKINSVEAILFAVGKPSSVDDICKLCDISKKEFELIFDTLQERYEDTSLKLTMLGEKCQIMTRAEYGDIIREALDKEKHVPLSAAALEVLSVIAYNEPVTRSFIDQIRGVDSSGVVNTLIEKSLVEEAGRLDLPGRPIAYRTTEVFLRSFSLNSTDELPKLPEIPENSNAE